MVAFEIYRKVLVDNKIMKFLHEAPIEPEVQIGWKYLSNK